MLCNLLDILNSPKPLMIVDGDSLAYLGSAASQKEAEFNPNDPDAYEIYISMKPSEALHYIGDKMRALSAHAPDAEQIIAFGNSKNFRKTLYPEYKANRLHSRKPVGLGKLRAKMKERYPYVLIDGIEADDLMGIAATFGEYCEKTVLVASDDKDMKSFPGTTLSISDTSAFPVCTSPHEAFQTAMLQTLTGDRADNYEGIPGCGPATAAKILGDMAGMSEYDIWQKVIKAYQKAKLTEEDAILQCRLAHILTINDVKKLTSRTISFKLWTPPVAAS